MGKHLLTEKDFVAVEDVEGNALPPVPKHWGVDQLPAGAKKKGRTSGSSTSGSSSSAPATPPAPPAGTEPAGNASTEAWAAFARSKGATDADLVDDKGEPLGREEIRAKYGITPA